MKYLLLIYTLIVTILLIEAYLTKTQDDGHPY